MTLGCRVEGMPRDTRLSNMRGNPVNVQIELWSGRGGRTEGDRGPEKGRWGWFSEKIKTKILLNGNVSSSRLRALLEVVTKLKWLNLFRQINFASKNDTQFNENHTMPLTCCSF